MNTCERCWLEPATMRPPDGSGLTWVCAGCYDALIDQRAALHFEDRVRDVMRSGEWLRTQWIARAVDDDPPYQWTRETLKRMPGVERRDAVEVKTGTVGLVTAEYEVPRDEWRLTER